MKTNVSINSEIIFERFVLNHNLEFHNFCLSLEKTYTSRKSADANASKLAIDILTDRPNIVSYASSVPTKRVDAGNRVKKNDVAIIKTIIIKDILISCLILSLPNTSTIISLIEYTSGIKNIATLALN